ncbi:hypothetical protein As57867_007379, partial [Aphanomyces stellatus]
MIFATVNDRASYMNQVTLHFTEAFDANQLISAFQTVVERHEILRTSFVTTTSGIFQIIRQDINGLVVPTVPAASIEDFLKTDRSRGFEIGDQYFVRLTIVESNDEKYGVLTIHHALYDGWTMSMLMSDIFDLLQNQDVVDRPKFSEVVDYIEAQDKDETEAYWRSYLAGVVASPIGSAGSKVIDDLPVGLEVSLSCEASMALADITSIAQRAGATVAELTKLAWAATLRKYTRQNDVVFGQVMANRDIPVKDADRILGPLLSTVPCRVCFDDEMSLTSLLRAVQSERGSMMRHSHASLVDMKRWSGIEGDFLDTLFVFQNLPDTTGSGDFSGLKVIQPESSEGFMKEFSLEVLIEPSSAAITMYMRSNPTYFTRSQARLILDELDFTLIQLCDGLETELTASTLWALSPTQTQLIDAASYGPQAPLPYELLHHGFEEKARLCPDLRAVEYEDEWLSYGELNAQANTLAFELAELGVSVGSRVAVIMDRCLEFPIGLLAALKV